MTNEQLLKNLQSDFNKLQVNKDAHIQIEQIINHYRQKIAEQQNPKDNE